MFPGTFLQALWGQWEGEGCAPIWVKQTKLTFHVPIDEIRAWSPETDSELLAEIGQRDAYTSPGLRRPGLEGRQQGGRRDIVALAGVVLDVDLNLTGAVHAAKNLPTMDDLGVVLDGPDPTFVVHTGGGIHAWWLFEKPFDTWDETGKNYAKKLYTAFQLPYRERAAKHGWHLDDTSKISHVFRLPGTRNWKRPETPLDVEVIYADGPRYRPTDLVRGLPVSVMLDRRCSLEDKPIELEGASSLEELEQKLAPVRLALKKISPTNERYELIQNLLKGRSLAKRGERDVALQRAVSHVAWLTPARTLSAELLAELFRPSLQAWALEQDSDKTVEEELDKVVEKFERAFEDRARDDARRAEDNLVLLKGLRKNGEEISLEDAEKIKLTRHAIILKGSTFWVWNFGQQSDNPRRVGYHGPWTMTELVPVCRDAWENGPDDFTIYHWTEKGRKTKTATMLVDEYATAGDVLGHFDLQESYYDVETNTFHEAICPLRVTTPEFDPEIDEWLHLLGNEQAEKMLDWVASVTRFDQQSSLMYLEGPPGCGKNLLANGLAKLWHPGGATPFESIMGTHNAEMFRCPLIQLDEGISTRFSHVTAQIRKLTGSSSHTYNQKHIVTRNVVGAVRMMITANNANVLSFEGEELGAHDLEAIVGRIFHVEVSRDAADWLIEKKKQDPEILDRWVRGEGIARHAVWLRDNRVVAPGDRFIVQGDHASRLHTNIITRGHRNGLVLEWLVKCLENPKGVLRDHGTAKKQFPRVLIGDGQLLVSTEAVQNAWQGVGRSSKEQLTTKSIGAALSQVSFETRKRLGPRNDRVRFYEVNTELVFAWADQNLVGNIELMQENLKTPLPVDLYKDPFLNVVE